MQQIRASEIETLERDAKEREDASKWKTDDEQKLKGRDEKQYLSCNTKKRIKFPGTEFGGFENKARQKQAMWCGQHIQWTGCHSEGPRQAEQWAQENTKRFSMSKCKV